MAVSRDPSGQDCAACPVGADLRARVRFLDEILDQTPTMMRRMKADSTIEYVNASAAKDLGGGKDDITGKKLLDLLSPQERDQVLENIKNLEAGDYYDVHTQSGRIQSWRDFTITDDDGNVVSFISMGEDVTEQRVAEDRDRAHLQQQNRALQKALAEAEAAGKAKATFLAEMSHDLRTPLNAILGFAQLIETGSAPPGREKDYAKDIRQSGESLLTLVQRVLDLSQAEAAPEREPAEIREVVELTELIRRLERQARTLLRPGVTFRADFADGPLHVYGDAIALMRAIQNLIENSAKFTTRGWIGVEARPRGDVAQIFVKDTGCGVEPADIERILRPFEHGAPQRDARKAMAPGAAHGHGMGLPLARRFIERQGGKFLFRSKPGVGTVVEIRLPLHKPKT